MFIGIIFMVTGICLAINRPEDMGWDAYLFWLMIPAGLYALVRGFRNLKNRKPQIILSSQGIETPSDGLVSWKDIDNAYIDLSKEDPLFIYLPYGHKKSFDLTTYGMEEAKLDRLLAIYLIRYEQTITKSL
jgi:hypothetical protein